MIDKSWTFQNIYTYDTVNYIFVDIQPDSTNIKNDPRTSVYWPPYILSIEGVYTRDDFYVRREVDLMKTAKVNAYIMHIFGMIELLSICAT